MAERNQAHEFMEALFGSKEQGHILVWEASKGIRESHWFETAAEASEYVENEKRQTNIYVGVGLSPEDKGIHKRCLASDIAGIPGFWLDLDVLDLDAHQKTNLPPSINDAREFLMSFPLEPTVVINSGHGLQAWWLFREFWYFESDQEREDAAHLAKRFIHTWREMAARRNWEVDPVHDLGRLMRVPGTTNYKHAPVPVRSLTCNPDTRYNLEDIEELLIENVQRATVERGKYGDLILDEDAQPPTEKLMALCENCPAFEMVLKHTDKRMDGQSPSEYDMSLANYAARAEWSAQEIVNLIIYHRRTNKLDKKMRVDYMERTIAKAMESKGKEWAQEKLQDVVLESNDIKSEADLDITPERRKEILEHISMMFGVEILRIERHLSDPPDYFLATSRGGVLLGPIENLVKQDRLRMKVATTTKKLFEKINDKSWHSIAQSLLLATEDVSVGEEATTRGSHRSWLHSYLRNSEVTDDPGQAMDTGEVYKDPQTGYFYIFLTEYQNYLKFAFQQRLAGKQIGQGMKALDCIQTKLNGYSEETQSKKQRQAWRLPRGFGNE